MRPSIDKRPDLGQLGLLGSDPAGSGNVDGGQLQCSHSLKTLVCIRGHADGGKMGG